MEILLFFLVALGLTIIFGIYFGWKFLDFLNKKMKKEEVHISIGLIFVLIFAIPILLIASFIDEDYMIQILLLIGCIIGMAIYCVVMFLRKKLSNKIEKDNDDSSTFQ